MSSDGGVHSGLKVKTLLPRAFQQLRNNLTRDLRPPPPLLTIYYISSLVLLNIYNARKSVTRVFFLFLFYRILLI